MTTEHSDTAPGSSCAACSLSSRRSFLQDLAGLVAAAVVGLGLDARAAAALPVQLASGRLTGRGDCTYPVPAADGVTIDRGNDVMLARYQGRVFAFSLACPHQNTALRWLQAEGRFQCPKHKSKYRPDGTFIEGRATRGMDRYAVRLVGNSVAVDIDKLYQEDTDLTQWQHAVVSLP
jgi:nitrite reductase/ring-hydroxylating ferredoxin subunit